MSDILNEKEKQRRTMIHSMSIEQATDELQELRVHMFDLRMKASRGEQKDVREFARTRKVIAMLKHKLHIAALYGEEAEFVEAPQDEEVAVTEEAAES